MEIERAIQIAKRERENIKVSLEMCGDIREIDPESVVIRRLTRADGFHLFRDLLEMENEIPTRGYFTPEAAYVFAKLASSVAENLGIRGKLAQIFGSGYSWVRTGCFGLNGLYDEEQQKYITKQLFFFKLFFPTGGGFNWDFNSPVVKTKLSLVFHTFVKWQDDPDIYIQDVEDYGDQLAPLLRGLYSALDSPVVQSRCRTYGYLRPHMLTSSPGLSCNL